MRMVGGEPHICFKHIEALMGDQNIVMGNLRAITHVHHSGIFLFVTQAGGKMHEVWFNGIGKSFSIDKATLIDGAVHLEFEE